MIKRILLENWRSHKRTELDFGKGTNVIVGIMGSGKTSVIDGICFALFGTFPSLNSRKISLDEVIMSKPFEADFAKVTLWFDYNGIDYFVERTVFSGNKINQAKFFKQNKLVAGPAVSAVTEAIEREIEMDYDLFSRAVYAEQNELDYFIRLSPRERKEKFDELLELDKYELVRSNASKLVGRLKDSIKDKTSFFEKRKSVFDELETISLEKKISAKKSELSEIESKKAIALERKKQLDSIVSELSKKQKLHSALKDFVLRATAKLEEMFREITDLEKRLQKKSTSELKSEFQEIEKALKGFAEQIQKIEIEAEELDSKLGAFSEKIGAGKSKLAETLRQLAELKNAKANCPICRRELGEHQKLEIEAESKKERERISAEILSLENALKAFLEKKRNFSAEKRKISTECIVLERKKIELSEIMDSGKKLEILRKNFLELEAEVSKSKKQLVELDFGEEFFASMQKESIQASSSIAMLERSQLDSAELLKQFFEQVKRIELEKKQLIELEKEIRENMLFVEKLGLFCNALKDAQGSLRTILIESINEAMHGSIWEKIYPYKDYVSARMEIVDGNYELQVQESHAGNWIKVEGILSGGERTAAALCIRMAFSLVLAQNIGWLILDEPTHNLDSNAVRELSITLKEHLPQLVEQVFVITHDKELEKAASSQLHVLQRDKNNNGITIVAKSD